jgi:hypothetical protein
MFKGRALKPLPTKRFECAVCFSKDKPKVYVIPCMHELCEECADRLFFMANDCLNTSLVYTPCPLCRSPMKALVKDLPLEGGLRAWVKRRV